MPNSDINQFLEKIKQTLSEMHSALDHYLEHKKSKISLFSKQDTASIAQNIKAALKLLDETLNRLGNIPETQDSIQRLKDLGDTLKNTIETVRDNLDERNTRSSGKFDKTLVPEISRGLKDLERISDEIGKYLEPPSYEPPPKYEDIYKPGPSRSK